MQIADRREHCVHRNRIALWILAARFLQRSVDGVAEDVNGDEVEQDRRQDLRGVAPEPHGRGDRSPDRASDERRGERGDHSVARGQECAEGAGEELPLAADVPDARAEGDGDGEAGQQQRDRFQQRPLQRECRSDRAADENREELARRMAEGDAGECEECDRERGGENGDGDSRERGVRSGRRELAKSHWSDPTPAISSGARCAASDGVSRALNAPR